MKKAEDTIVQLVNQIRGLEVRISEMETRTTTMENKIKEDEVRFTEMEATATAESQETSPSPVKHNNKCCDHGGTQPSDSLTVLRERHAADRLDLKRR